MPVLSAGKAAFRRISILRFDLREILRSLNPQKRSGILEPRADDELAWVDDEPAIGGPLFLDTTVYLSDPRFNEVGFGNCPADDR